MSTRLGIKYFFNCAAMVMALLLTACGDDDEVINNAPGPAVYTSFEGVTLEINPTLKFLTGGQVSYLNTASGSAFPAALTAIAGSYTYTPASNYLSGTLKLTLPGLNQTLSMTLQSFVTQGGSVTSFTTVYNGQSYTSNVTAGSLTSAKLTGGSTNTGGSSSGGTNTGGSTPTTPTSPTTTTPVGANETLAPDVPSSVQGSYDLVYDYAQPNSPITNGTKKTFVIGAKTLQFDGKTISGAVHRNQNANEWIFKDTDLEYQVSKRTDNTLNEINVGKLGGTPWYGQFKQDANATSGTGSGNSGSGSNTGSGSTVTATGNFAAGTSFTYKVISLNSKPDGMARPASIPNYAIGESITFTIDSNGALNFRDSTLNYKSSANGFNVYESIAADASESIVASIAQQEGSAPARITLTYTKTTIALPPVVYALAYVLN